MPEALFDSEDNIEEWKTERQELAALAGVKLRAWNPTTLKTAVNALMMKYRETALERAVVAVVSAQVTLGQTHSTVECR